jgi:hypothetical protein
MISRVACRESNTCRPTSDRRAMNHRVFISSLSDPRPDQPTARKGLRTTLHEKFGDALWIAEKSAPHLANLRGSRDLEIVDTCTDAISHATDFVCIFESGRGSAIRVGDALANAAHFETELFHAVLAGKRVHAFVMEGFAPDPLVRELLDVVGAALGEKIWEQQFTEKQIVDGVGRVLRHPSRAMGLGLMRRLVCELFDSRTHESRTRTLTDFFAGNSLVDARHTPNIGLIRDVTDSLAAIPDQRKRLSRLYIALREVLSQPIEDNSLLPIRNRLLGGWCGAASWYGLHAHLRSGVLAAAKSTVIVRSRLRHVKAHDEPDEALVYPGGQLASALFSIAKRLPTPRKKLALHEALGHLGESLREPGRKHDNLLAIRGSVYRELGKLGYALDDYRTVVRLREGGGAEPTAVGDAWSELGFGYLMQRKFRKALECAERGVELMQSGGNTGFLLRGMRKLALARAANLRPCSAWKVFKESRQIATDMKMFDQLSGTRR